MKQRALSRTWLKVFLFLVVLGGLTQLFSIIARQRSHEKNGNYWPYFFEELPENSVDVIYMGSSHSNSTFIPEIIDDILDIRSIHVNTSGESIYQTALEYEEVLRHQDPRAVVIETYPIYDGLSQQELKPWNYSFFFAVPSPLRRMAYAHRFLSMENLVYFYLPYTIFHANWKEPADVAERVIAAAVSAGGGADTLELPHQGYFNYMESLLPIGWGGEPKPAPETCGIPDLPQRLEKTAEIIALDLENPAELLFVEAPQLVNDFAACREEVMRGVQALGGEYLTLLEDQSRARLWFGDHEHMTQFGALIASVELAERLAERLDLTVDAEALAFYRSYFFRDYTISRNSGQVSVQLIPYDEESASNLYFTWSLFQGEQQLDQAEGINQSQMTFTLPEPEGVYTLQVNIYNLDGSYNLRGIFNVPQDQGKGSAE